MQGGADDQECWSRGLTAALFWEHQEELLESPADVDSKIQQLVNEEVQRKTYNLGEKAMAADKLVCIGSTGILFGSKIVELPGDQDFVIDCCETTAEPLTSPQVLHVPVAVRYS